MRNGSDDDHLRSTTFGSGPFGAVPSIGVPDSTDDAFALGDLVAALRRPADLGPSVDTAVMDAIRLAPAPLVVVPGTARRPTTRTRASNVPATVTSPELGAPLPRAWRWFTRPRAVRVTPLGALAAAGIAVAATFGLRREASRRAGELDATLSERSSATGEFAAVRADGATPAPVAARTRDTVVVTRFLFAAPGAKQVTVVGDFNDWDHGATPLVPVASHGSGNGLWTVTVPLTAGRHTYVFLVDGQRWVADPTQPRAIDDDFGRPNSAITVGGGET
ncbi:hypothetical protein tb265_23310 [Gemmatimonadetes bacterium T265]|nr:hypothetical protein tb265_23310 [Gemmatimonadetes bacterium T265]